MNKTQSGLPGWPFIFVAVGIVAGGGPAIVKSLEWKPPPLTTDESGATVAACRGDVYEGDRRIANLEDLKALRRTQCIRGNLTIGVERCEMGGGAKKDAPRVQLESLKHLKNLEVVTGALRIQGVSGLTDVKELTHLTSVGGLELCDSGELTSLTLPALQLAGKLSLSRSAIATINAPQLRRVEAIRADGSPLRELLTARPLAVGRIELELRSWGGGEAVAVPSPAWLASVDTARLVAVQSASGLSALQLPSLTAVDELAIDYNRQLTSLEAPRLTSAKSVRLTNNESLQRVELGALATVDVLTMSDSPKLSRLSLGPITDVSQLVVDNTGLSALPLGSLRAAKRLSIEDNPLLSSLDLRSLSSAQGGIQRNAVLRAASRDAIAAVKGLRVCENDDQPPCAWDAPFRLRRVTAPLHDTTLSGAHVRIPGGDSRVAGAIALLTRNAHFHSASTYVFHQRPFGYTVVETVKDKAIAVLSVPDREEAEQLLYFKLNGSYTDYAVFEGYPNFGFIGRVDGAIGGPFVVDPYIMRNGAVEPLGRVDVSAVALDPAAILGGLKSAVLAMLPNVAVAFAANPDDMKYPNLPVVFDYLNGRLEPNMTLRTARAPAP